MLHLARNNVKMFSNNKYAYIVKRFNSDLKNYMEKKFNEYDKHRLVNYPNIPLFKIALGCGIFSLGTIGFYFIFKEQIHMYLSHQGSEIAGNIVSSNDVQTSLNDLIKHPETTQIVNDLSKNVINQLCQNDDIKDKLAQLIMDILNRPDVKDKITNSVVEIINQPIVINELNVAIKNITDDKNNIKQVTKLMTDIIESDGVNKSIKNAFYKLFFK